MEDGNDDTNFDVKKNLLPELTEGLIAEDRVKVFLRIRPFTASELSANGSQDCIKVESDTSLLIRNSHRGDSNRQQRFTFSHIFNEDASQQCVFDKAILPTLKDFMNGENCLIFTYGVTNAGKTYTIHGDAVHSGILPRSLDAIFNAIAGCEYAHCNLKPDLFCDVVRLNVEQEQVEHDIKQSVLSMLFNATAENNAFTSSTSISVSSCATAVEDESRSILAEREDEEDVDTVVANRCHNLISDDMKSHGNIRYSVWVSFAEIYNEQVFDLLVAPPNKKAVRRPVLLLREDRHGRPFIKGLKQVQITSAEEANRILSVGRQNLHFACTKMNQSSSRSHCIFTIKLIRIGDQENSSAARVSMLSFCDLAGSERNNKTQGIGERLKEAGNINSSLLALGRCITVLRRNQSNRYNQSQVVPFRDSKLTRLFQSFFTGKGKVSMIVNINRCSSVLDETIFAIRYSAIAQQIVVTQATQLHQVTKSLDLSNKVEDFPQNLHPVNRNTIAWASPGTYQKLIEEGQLCMSLALATDANNASLSDYGEQLLNHESPLVEVCEASDISSSVLVEEVGICTSKEHDELKEVIRLLKEKLVEAHLDIQTTEARIREEVCEEMKKQFVDIEKRHQETLRVHSEIMEEKYEKKIAIIKDAMQKSRKRQRIDDCEDIPDHRQLLDRLQELEQEVMELRENFKVVSQERDRALQQKVKLEFTVASLQQEIIEIKNKNAQVTAVFDSGNHSMQAKNQDCTHDFNISKLSRLSGPDSSNKSFRRHATLKRRRKLMSKQDEQLVTVVPDVQNCDDNETTDPHQIVRRRLRERQHFAI